MMDDRERKRALVLLIAYLNGKVSGKTKFQKFAFLIQREANSELFKDAFGFVPYYYGPYSEDLSKTIGQLVVEQMIAPDPYVVTRDGEDRMGSSFWITELGKTEALRQIQTLPPAEIEKVRQILGRYRTRRLPDLLEYVYSNYPEMTLQGRR